MPGGFSDNLDICNGTDVGTSTAASRGTSVTIGAHTVGSFVQLIASTAADCCWMMVQIGPPDGSANVCAMDIAVGASASEKVIFQELVASGSTNIEGSVHYLLPCSIPAGTRISARGAGNVSDSAFVSIILFDGAFTQIEGAAGVDAIGYVSATGLATAITPSATVNTKSAYTQLIAATNVDYCGLILNYSNLAASVTNADYLVDIAIGTSGSEVVIIPNVHITPGGFILSPNVTGPLWIAIPAGTRIAARAQASVASSTAFGLMVYGIYR